MRGWWRQSAWRTRFGRWFGRAGVLAALSALAYAADAPIGAQLLAGASFVCVGAGGATILFAGGALDEAAEQFWTKQGINLPAPRLQMRLVAAMMLVMGLLGLALLVSVVVGSW